MKIKVTVSMGLIDCNDSREFDIDAEEWESMSDAEKDETLIDEVRSMVDWDYEEISD